MLRSLDNCFYCQGLKNYQPQKGGKWIIYDYFILKSPKKEYVRFLSTQIYKLTSQRKFLNKQLDKLQTQLKDYQKEKVKTEKWLKEN